MPAIKTDKATISKKGMGRRVSAFATHADLLADMDAYRLKVTATPETAMAFLKRAGLVTPSGKPRQLIRG